MKFLEAKALKAASQNKATQPRENKATPPVHTPAPKVKADVRELAAELGVDLATVRGTGKDGAITVLDVKTANISRTKEPVVGSFAAPDVFSNTVTES